MNRFRLMSAVLAGVVLAAAPARGEETKVERIEHPFPHQAHCMFAPKHENVGRFCDFVSKEMPAHGYDTLILRVNYSYAYESHPECRAADVLTKEDLKRILATCRASGVKLIPYANLFGHQPGSALTNGVATVGILKAYPEMDESRGERTVRSASRRSICPRHPKALDLALDLARELAAVCEADSFHFGCDEVFEIGLCERCRGTDKAHLFAEWVNAFARGLKESGLVPYIWADRLIDRKATGCMDDWEASDSGTEKALALLDRDIVLCPWHYWDRKNYSSVERLGAAGHKVWISTWCHGSAAKQFIDYAAKQARPYVQGVLMTSWRTAESFLDAIEGKIPPSTTNAAEAVSLNESIVFRDLARAKSAPVGFKMYNIAPYSPGNEKILAADCREYVARTGNRTVLYSLTLHPEGKPALTKVDRALESYRALKAELAGSDVELGILIQAIVGHWGRVDRENEPWMRARGLDGRILRFCPLDPGYADYIRTVGRRCAAEKPCFILGDDDIRAFSSGPECFCERHRALFSERMGRTYTDEEFRAAVRASRPGDRVQTTFIELQRQQVCRVASLLREGIDSVDPTIPSGACQPGWEHRYADRAARAIAAKGQHPILRIGNSRYCESGAGGYGWNVLHTLSLASRFEGVVDVLDEADTYPQNYWSKSAISFHTHLATAAMCGLRGAKIWYVNGHKNGFPVNRGYTDVLADHRGYYDAIAAAVEGTQAVGFTTPCHNLIPDGPFPTYQKNSWAELHSYSLSQAAHYGVPLRSSFNLAERSAVYSLSSAEEVARHTDGQLKGILSCRAFVDGEAAAELAKRGFSDLIGCTATNRASGFTCEKDARTGRFIVLTPSDKPPELRPLPGATPLSWLCFQPFSGSTDFERIAPGSLAYTNYLGGIVVTGAFRNDTAHHHALGESRKQWFVDCLDVLNGGFTPFVCGNPQDVVALARRSPKGYAVVSLCNTCPDAIRGVSLRLPGGTKSVSVLDPHGIWRELAFTRGADGYATLPVTIPYYDTAVFMVK